MKKLHAQLFLPKLALFWLLLFTALRVLFLLYYNQLLQAENIPAEAILMTFSAAFWLDISTIGYLLALPFLLFSIAGTLQKRFPLHLITFYILLMTALYVLMALGETGLYAEWKTKLSYKALSYLKQPSEVFNSVETSKFFVLIVIWCFVSFAAILLYFKWFNFKRSSALPSRKQTFLFFPVWLILLFLGIRGGLKEIPITTSAAYFSSYNILNITAVNPAYNLLVSAMDSRRFNKENLFKSMPDDEARLLVDELHQTKCDSTVSILKTKQPNIVVVLLESWSADLIASLGGEEGITPHFAELEKEGLLFTNFYASANRSQQAIGSLFAGMPGLPLTTITNHPEKYNALPSLIKLLNKENYHSSFYFGGQLIYGNILSYLIYNEFDKIVEGDDIQEDFPRGKLGVHDSFMLPWFAHELSNLPQPFFSTVFTLSSHSPYDFPMDHPIQWPKLEKDFINSAHYTDKALALFFETARKQSWYENTLFLIMADHSHNTYRNHPIETFDYRKIPLLISGPALKDSLRGKQFDLICGNTDIPATILAQLSLPREAFFWSKNVFNSCYQPFAYFETNEGLGFKTPEGHFVWNKKLDVFYQKNLPPEKEEQIIKQGKAYLQVWFEEFLGY
ncbi:MAG: sulfatase-like hydrolase/transferase [Bacteroidetes bacterium]|nr:sulfatase-like hydrolase/transferase [Bacteroidota bacterium]MBU1580377.1 sulfatase-like hydrolase/transferase [Bacteroidota bacterium]MBU2557917.1 sulfatase-like hydrolase/transferase [Bacteroidota bacterium]